MFNNLFKTLILIHLLSYVLFASSATYSLVKYKIHLPPSVKLYYSLTSQENNLVKITGNALVSWYYKENIYKINSEIRVTIIGKILEASSQGEVTNFGLVPNIFFEKRFLKQSTAMILNHEYHNFYFAHLETDCTLQNNKQDRISIIWQLVSVARGNFSKFINGSTWIFLVSNNNQIEQWRFKIIGQEEIKTSLREFNTIHLFYDASSENHNWKLDIWLAPSFEWYPVRLRFTDLHGNVIEQILHSIKKYYR